MKSTFSFTLIVCLLASAVPVGAQEKTETLVPLGPASPMAPGVLTRAVTRDAVQFAAAQQSNTAHADWSAVRKVSPGREIIVTVTGSQPATRYLVLVDDSALTVVNLTDLAGHAKDALRVMASSHPQYFVDAQKGKVSAFKINADLRGFGGVNVRVGPDGAFVADRKVADLGQIVESITRTDVLNVTETKTGLSTGHLVAILAAAAGLIVFLVIPKGG